MFNKNPKKYKLLRKETVRNPLTGEQDAYRIQALVDIPKYNIKAGDIGGYVGNKHSLSHEGSCWIMDDAFVAGPLHGKHVVSGDALIRNTACVSGDSKVRESSQVSGEVVLSSATLRGNVSIMGNSYVHIGVLHGKIFVDLEDAPFTTLSSSANLYGVNLYGSITITGKARVRHSFLKGYAGIHDNAIVTGSRIVGNAVIKEFGTMTDAQATGELEISGNAKVTKGCRLSGINKFGGDIILKENSIIENISKRSTPSYPNVETVDIMDTQAIELLLSNLNSTDESTPSPRMNESINEYVTTLEEIEREYKTYTDDIVNILQYPAMTDVSVPETEDFIIALRAAKRIKADVDTEKFKQAVENLDRCFVKAVGKAKRVTQKYLDEKDQVTLGKAKSMFAIAFNEASSDNEKLLGAKAGIKALEGIIPVSEEAIQVIKVRTGLLELER